MKFAVVVGNPPFQRADGGHGASARPLYPSFVEAAKLLAGEYVAMVLPARWFAGGKDINAFRADMIDDRRTVRITDYPAAVDVFPDAEIKGGVMHFLWSSDHDGDCEWVTCRRGIYSTPFTVDLRAAGDVILRDELAYSILRKVQMVHGPASRWMHQEVSSSWPFGLRTYNKGSVEQSDGHVKIYQNGGVGWLPPEAITAHPQWVHMFKVLLPGAAGDGMKALPNMVLGRPFIAEPGSACTETYRVAGLYDTAIEAERRVAYIKTRFFRYMVSLRKIAQHNQAKVFAFVPVMDPDVLWTDVLLYEHFGLSNTEIAHIEATVKEMP